MAHSGAFANDHTTIWPGESTSPPSGPNPWQWLGPCGPGLGTNPKGLDLGGDALPTKPQSYDLAWH
eukprot:10941959-Karenia_brevis.AAC.1